MRRDIRAEAEGSRPNQKVTGFQEEQPVVPEVKKGPKTLHRSRLPSACLEISLIFGEAAHLTSA